MRYPQVAGNLEIITGSLCLDMATLSIGADLGATLLPPSPPPRVKYDSD
jgi:hypothetical protein